MSRTTDILDGPTEQRETPPKAQRPVDGGQCGCTRSAWCDMHRGRLTPRARAARRPAARPERDDE